MPRPTLVPSITVRLVPAPPNRERAVRFLRELIAQARAAKAAKKKDRAA